MKKVIVIVVAVFALLIFLSGTIYNFNRPTVTAAMPIHGNLQHTELTTGIVYIYHAEESVMFAILDGIATAVLVSEGDTVYMGQPLIEMSFRETDIYERIETVHADYREQSENLRLAKARIQLELEKLPQAVQADTISDFEIRQIELNIYHSEAFLEQTHILYTAGIAARIELHNAENKLEELQLLHESLLMSYEEKIERQNENMEKQARDLQHRRDLLALEMEALTLQRVMLTRERDTQLRQYERRLQDYNDNAVLTAPADGVITSLHITQGQHIGSNQQLMTFGLGSKLLVECTVPASRDFIKIGSTATLYNSNHVLEGTVTQIQYENNARRITIIPSEGVNLGETFMIRFEETSDVDFTLVPNAAINRDNEGYFLHQIRRRQGVLGTEFYTIRQSIFIGDSDSTHTAVIWGIQTFEPIAVLSDRPFAHEQTILLSNEGDLFVR